jgi:hypothetical protein
MTTPLVGWPLPAPDPGKLKKKRVLLVDTSPGKRDLRAEIMRKLGMEVDCAADIPEARSWWRADLYDLVLVSMAKGPGHRDKFCEDVRGASPPQQLAFLVGKPEYLARSPQADGESSDGESSVEENYNEATLAREVPVAGAADGGHRTQRWGILEASRRISVVRSAAHARAQAMRDKPAPPRDLETRYAKLPTTESRTLDELLKEEMP